MKVLLIHNKYKSKSIGGEDVVFDRELLSLKKKLGFDNVFEYSVCNDDIKISKLIFSIWFSREHYRNVYKLVVKNNIDIVHVHNFYPLLTTSIFKAAKKSGAKTIQTLHNFRWWCISGIFYRDKGGVCELCSGKKLPFWGIIYRCYRKSFLQSILTSLSLFFYKATRQDKYIDKFFVLSNFQKKKVIDLGVSPEKVILKSNFVNIESNKNSNKKDFIYVGKLDESKGVLELLKIWSKLGGNYKLKLIGTGDLDGDIDSYKSENIIFLGRLNNKKTLEEISKSKYLIAPSLMYETFGLTIIEAMSLGVPVIGLNIGTRPGFIKDGDNGFIGDLESLKGMIERAYNFNNYSKLSNNAIDFSKNFSEDKIIADQISIYQDIINKKS